MLKNVVSLLLLVVLLSGVNLFAQDKVNTLSLGIAPRAQMNPLPINVSPLPAGPLAWYSRAFGYNAYGGSIALGPFKMFLNPPFNMVSLYTDPSSANFVEAGSFDASGNWWGARYSTNALVKIDTSTGILTQIATITGATSITGMAWDFTTSTMYASDYGTSNKLGTLNLSTGVFTPLSGVVGTGLLIDIACSNSGNIYGHMITAPTTPSQIYLINKSTGVGTALSGTTGFDANYAQGMSWDHSVDTGYLAAYNYTTSTGELRKIDIATGNTTLVGNLVSEVDGFAIPGAPGPSITHTPLPNTQNLTGPYVVNCVITAAGSPISTGKIFWSRNNVTVTDSVTMTNSSGNNWTGNIPGNGTAATYRYYLKAIDGLGRVGVAPGGAPTTLYMFTASSTDTSKPVITHTPIGNTPKVNWPATVLCTATEPFGIDSVWVRWYKNSGAYTRFNLANIGGGNWSAAFNSDTSQVQPNDVIYYRIIARSASTQHTMDSTTLYNFTIVNQVTACIGTGTTASDYPFGTYWEDGRTQLLYLSSEITGAGGASGYILSIGLNVQSVGGPAMDGFNIRMQNTSVSTISAWTSTNWTTCYSGTYTVSGTGWQYITLTTPFYWTSGQNLLMEICYNNAAWTAYSPVNASTASGLMIGYEMDLPSGDGCTEPTWTASALAYRDNMCFVMNPGPNSVGIGNIGVPNTYKLSQNYPNPFNPTTKIDFAIPKNGFVTLKIYDVLGREVRKLVNETKTAGYYSVDFNASEFSSGVYFYKLESNGFSDVKRMMLIK
jgi:hypothetical protein